MERVAVLTIESDLTQWTVAETDKLFTDAATLLDALFQETLLVTIGKNSFDPNERQWVFTDAVSALLYFRLLKQLLYPIALSGGLGVSEQDADYLYYQTARHYAHEALKQTRAFSFPVILYHANYFEDMVVNRLLLDWCELMASRAPLQQLLEVLYELQLPLYKQGSLIPHQWKMETLLSLFNKKYILQQKIPKLAYLSLWDLEYLKAPTWLETYQALDGKMLYPSGLYRKGFATAIARTTGMTRQNIDYHLQSGDFNKERHLFATIVMQLEREKQAMSN